MPSTGPFGAKGGDYDDQVGPNRRARRGPRLRHRDGSAVWEDETETDPTVTTSLRLPKSLLDWIRERAIEHFPAATVVGGVRKAGARIGL